MNMTQSPRATLLLLGQVAGTLLVTVTISLNLPSMNEILYAKGKPPKDPPPVLPDVAYQIDLLPLGGANANASQMNSLGMIVGQLEDMYAFMFDFDGALSATSQAYVFDDLEPLTNQLAALLDDPGSHFLSAEGVNNGGDIVGSAEDSFGNVTGYVIETFLDPDPSVWLVHLLPDLGSPFSFGKWINDQGTVLGLYDRPDGSRDAYLYSTTQGLVTLGLNLVRGEDPVLNNLDQVAGVQLDNTAFFVDAPFGDLQIEVFDEIDNYARVKGLNDSGVFSGRAWTRVKKQGRKGVAFRHTTQPAPGQLELVTVDDEVTTAGWINESSDILAENPNALSVYLVHTGFEAEPIDQVLNLDDLIDENDPWRDLWINQWLVNAKDLGERDLTGYGRILVRVWNSEGVGGVAVLTPFIPAP